MLWHSSADLRVGRAPLDDKLIEGPYASLLAASTDLGPAREQSIQLTASLTDQSEPQALIDWAREKSLSVQWRPGDDWVVVEGSPDAVERAFDVSVRDYRGRKGQHFYASPHQPAVPEHLRGEVSEIGRILSYTPHHMSRPDHFPLDVPDRGLAPDALLNTYNADDLARAGFTGKGVTIVIFAFDGFKQSDLDKFTTTFGLPQFTPEVVGGSPGEPRGELSMDLQVAHAIAPDARKVVVNARPTVEGGGGYRKIGEMLEDTDRQFPGAVWSFSIGWGCDKLITAADLAPVRSALRTAQSHGTTAYNASGDLAGMECSGGQDWSSPPERTGHRPRLDRVAARDDQCRRHHAVHRRRRDVGVRADLVRRPAVPGHRRRRVDTVRHAALAARGRRRGRTRTQHRQAHDTGHRRGGRPVHRREDRARRPDRRRRRHLAVGTHLGRV